MFLCVIWFNKINNQLKLKQYVTLIKKKKVCVLYNFIFFGLKFLYVIAFFELQPPPLFIYQNPPSTEFS